MQSDVVNIVLLSDNWNWVRIAKGSELETAGLAIILEHIKHS